MSDLVLPKIGFGTWQLTDPKQCVTSVKTAIETGYRFIDTAQGYRNEESVGKGIQEADIDREELILATKVWITNLGYEDVLASTEASLKKLAVDKLDILYIHWPAKTYDPQETFRAFEELQDQDKIGHIGVSNFTRELLDEALEVCNNPIQVNQIEMHPFYKQEKMREYLKKKNIYLVAYSPLARGKVLNHPALTKIAEDYDVNEAGISLAWSMTLENTIPIPKATSKEHIVANFQATAIRLSPEETETLSNLPNNDKLIDPPFAPNW